MPNRIILADDEPSIREGLRDIVDWAGLGYTVAGVYEDGRAVLAHLRRDPVDVVLTDIRMPHVSGLDIAQSIREASLHTKVVLISGYKDVELAMSAIKFGVSRYIVKPIDITELESCLGELSEQLERERMQRNDQRILAYYQRNIREFKDDFLFELSSGSFANERTLVTAFHLLFPNLTLERTHCFMLTVAFRDYEAFLKNRWKHTASELYACLQSVINLSEGPIEYHLLLKTRDTLCVLGIVPEPYELPLEAHITRCNARLYRELHDLFGIEAYTSELRIFSTIIELSMSRNKTTLLSPDEEGLRLRLHEQEKALCSLLGKQETDKLENALNRLLSDYAEIGLDAAKERAVQLLPALREILRDAPDAQHAETLLRDAPDEGAFRAAFSSLVLRQPPQANIEGDRIARIKAYIIEHILEDPSLEDLSENFFLSQYYISRTFKAETGENLIDFIVEQKIRKAKELLLQPGYKVHEISDMVGYKSGRYFTKIFKAHTGYTPNEYRQLYSSPPQ